MKRWWVALGVAVAACLAIVACRSSNPGMLGDTDTAVLLQTLKERNAPLSWFAGDWPLGNHFYRPVSTLTFELDQRLYGDNAAGFGLTNALLCAGCVLMLFWFLRELTDRPGLSAAGAALFGIWNLSAGAQVLGWLPWLAAIPLAGAFLPGRRWMNGVFAAFAWLFVCSEANGMWPLMGRMIQWLPGRTASAMTLFALAALAAYARYERTSAQRRPDPPPSPFDTPDYKRPPTSGEPAKGAWLWAVACCLFALLALGSYEQAVMLPAALLGVALTLRWRGFRVRFGWQAAFWGLLAGYLALRWAVLPHDVSGYQQQQFRDGPGVFQSIMEYVLPVFGHIRTGMIILIEQGPIVLILSQWVDVYLGFGATLSVLSLLRRDWVLPLAGWALSILTFLPMAWVKHFDHYHYWPMAMRALFVVALLPVVAKATVTALSPQAVQAPPRPDPAPGSLLRP